MPKFFSIICAFLCCGVIIGTAVCISEKDEEASEDGLQVINLWQIDSFEGGKGSRAEYLKSLDSQFYKENNVYIEVTALSADAARENIDNGVLPDMISYGSGFYGLESVINLNYPTLVWCRGGYCLLSVESDDFSDVKVENTLINSGKDNLTMAAALLCGLENADVMQPTSAYVSLINGNYKYLLGTQRDIVRLITRGVKFYVNPITQFNDLYQNFSVITEDSQKGNVCGAFAEYVISKSENLSRLCLFCDGAKLYDNELNAMEGLGFTYTVSAFMGKTAYDGIISAIETFDSDKLKSLLKLL